MLETTEWKPFLLTELFDIEYGNKLDLNKMKQSEKSKISFVSRTAKNNGVSASVEELENLSPYPEGLLTVALGGSIGSTFVQILPFYTGQNVAVLIPKYAMSDFSKLFIATLIKLESDTRFIAFGRELNVHIKSDFTINFPISSSRPYACDIKTKKELYLPNLEIIEDYVKSLYMNINASIGTMLENLIS
jgi:Type I restriction modification DNA specificity domain.